MAISTDGWYASNAGSNLWRYPRMDGMPAMQVRRIQTNFWRYSGMDALPATVACSSSCMLKSGKKIVDN